MRMPRVRRVLLFAAALLFLSVAWVPSSSRTALPSVTVLLPVSPPAAGALEPQFVAVDPQKLAQAVADPNAAEYYYQQALLLAGRNRHR